MPIAVLRQSEDGPGVVRVLWVRTRGVIVVSCIFLEGGGEITYDAKAEVDTTYRHVTMLVLQTMEHIIYHIKQ